MKGKEFNTTEIFEKDSLAAFDKLLQCYNRAIQTCVWENNEEQLLKELTHLPTAPFPIRLMEMFNYDYLVSSEDIESIIDRALAIRIEMESTQRKIRFHRKYFFFPFARNL